MNIYPNTETLNYWSNHFFNDFDLFFMSDSKIIDDQIVTMTKDEFYNSNLYNINTINLYTLWNLKHYNYVIKAPFEWFEQLDIRTQHFIIQEQQNVNNPQFNSDKLMTTYQWQNSSFVDKKNYFINLIDLYADNFVEDIHLDIPQHLSIINNTFALNAGSNCLSTVLYAITRSNELLNQWIKGEFFLKTLHQLGYKITKNPSKQSDVIAYFNNETVVHAAYLVNDHYLINKNGQTIFNPYKLISHQSLDHVWSGYSKVVYRLDK